MDTRKMYASGEVKKQDTTLHFGIDITCADWGNTTVVLLDFGDTLGKIVVLTEKDDDFLSKWDDVRGAIADRLAVCLSQVKCMPDGFV